MRKLDKEVRKHYTFNRAAPMQWSLWRPRPVRTRVSVALINALLIRRLLYSNFLALAVVPLLPFPISRQNLRPPKVRQSRPTYFSNIFRCESQNKLIR